MPVSEYILVPKSEAPLSVVIEYDISTGDWVVGDFCALDDLDIPEQRRELGRANGISGAMLQELGRFPTKEKANAFVSKLL